MTASIIGTSSSFPADSQNSLAVQVLKVSSKIALLLTTTTIFVCESNSVQNGGLCIGSLSTDAISGASWVTRDCTEIFK